MVDITQDLVPDDTKLKTVSSLAAQMISKQMEITKAAEILQRLTEEYTVLETKTLPDALLSAGVQQFKMAGTGIIIQLAEGMYISVPKKNMPQITSWLRKRGHGDIIKNEVVVPVPKGKQSAELVKKLEDNLKKLKLKYTREESVHSGTLKALLKEQRDKGVVIDLKLFGAFEYKKAEIVLPK